MTSSELEEDALYESMINETPIVSEKPTPPGWNVVATKKKAPKPKDPAADAIKSPPALPIACKFFKLGKCSAGKGCRFSHDPNAPIGSPSENGTSQTTTTATTTKQSSSPPSSASFPCKFHAAGYCRNGPKCPFLHATRKPANPPPVQGPVVINKAAQPAPPQVNGFHPIPTPTTTTTNTFPTATNIFPTATNIFPTATNIFPTATNTFPTANNTTSFPTATSFPTQPISPSKFSSNGPLPTSPIATSPAKYNSDMNIPFPTARSPTAQQHNTTIMNLWPASPPVSNNIHSAPFFSSSPTSASSFPSPRHMVNAIPSLASLPSSPSYLSSSPFALFMATKEEEDEDDEDDELLPIPGLTIIDDTPDDFVFNPYDDILNLNDDDDLIPMSKTNGKYTNDTNGSSTATSPPPPDNSSSRSFADIVKNTITVSKSTQLIEEEKELAEMNNKLCQFFVQGICRYGSGCRYIHGNVCESCQKPCLLVDNPQQNEEHILSCEMHMKMMSVREASKDVDCGICYEKTVDKGRRFGLLSHCEHPFCLECIREWRGGSSAPTTTLRSCPICRVTSYYIIPSEGMIFDGERKQEIIEQYKSKLTTITCKYFKSGKGVCKFGSSCMYSHSNPDGTLYVPPPPRKMQDSEGEVAFYNGLKLGAFLGDFV